MSCSYGIKVQQRSVTCLIATFGFGMTCYIMNQSYIQRFTDNLGNICKKAVMRKDLASFYFKHSNVIDTHNNERQFQLRLEKNGNEGSILTNLQNYSIFLCSRYCSRARSDTMELIK